MLNRQSITTELLDRTLSCINTYKERNYVMLRPFSDSLISTKSIPFTIRGHRFPEKLFTPTAMKNIGVVLKPGLIMPSNYIWSAPTYGWYIPEWVDIFLSIYTEDNLFENQFKTSPTFYDKEAELSFYMELLKENIGLFSDNYEFKNKLVYLNRMGGLIESARYLEEALLDLIKELD